MKKSKGLSFSLPTGREADLLDHESLQEAQNTESINQASGLKEYCLLDL